METKQKMEVQGNEFVSRSYQSDILDIAIKQNTIIYLPTGSGKTYIAIMLIKELSHSIIKPLAEGGKLTFFLVNTVALVEQHYYTIKRHTDFEVGRFTGDMNVDYWSGTQWMSQLENYQIAIMTAQIFLDFLRHGYFCLTRVNLLIFDECHQAVDDHSMRLIMQLFMNVPVDKQPRVLGLTATLLNSNCKPQQVKQLVFKLETTYHSKVATVRQLAEVLGYSTNPHERIVYFSTGYECPLVIKIKTMLLRVYEFITTVKISHSMPKSKEKRVLLNSPHRESKELGKVIQNIIIHMDMLGIYSTWKAALVYIIYIERLKKRTEDGMMDKMLTVISTQLTAIMKLLEDEMAGYSEQDKIIKFSTPQLLLLLDILKNSKKKDSLCGIVFVQRRFTAKIIFYVLNALSKYSEEYNYIRSNYIVGLNAHSAEKENREALLVNKFNKKVMRSFNDGDLNLLIASNCVEEGIDIPRCTLVVKFDYPTNYRSYIQSKGRARHRDSDYVVMVPKKETLKFNERYCGYQLVESILSDLLIGKNELRDSPSKADIENELYKDQVLPTYYVDGPNSPHVTAVSAISLLNRYCQSLTRDKYSQPAPTWYLETYENKFSIVIEMPIMCPIHYAIKGKLMSTKMNAKRAAALLVCEMLHKCGELNNNMLPQNEIIESEENDSYLFKHWLPEKIELGQPKPGTKKYIRAHKMLIPPCLVGRPLTHGIDLYLHTIEISSSFNGLIDNEYSLKMQHDLMKSELGYALLTVNILPQLCSFPLYVSAGDLKVHLRVNDTVVRLTEMQLMLLRTFHNFVFSKVLNVLKDFMLLDNSADGEAMLLVPVRSTGGREKTQIDFEIAEHYTVMKPVEEPTSKSDLNVTDERYLGHVVCPWYRMSDTQYIVTKVCYNMSPLSPFPTKDLDTYVHYFNEKYNVNVSHPNQPLLLVKAMSKRLNCLKPRATSLCGKRNKIAMQENFEEHLIPEMCVLQKFPAVLWYKAFCLPSILHRIIYLLRADTLRRSINRATKLGIIDLPPNQSWADMPVDPATLKPEDKKLQAVPQRNVAEGEAIALPPATAPPSNIRPSNKDYASRMLEKMYPWKDEQEPMDIERNIEFVRLMEIIDYERFISLSVSDTDCLDAYDLSNYQKDMPALTMPKKDEIYVFRAIDMLREKGTGIGPELWQMYQVLMAAKANDVVNFERLETLGDSFLKLSVSLFLLLKYPQYNEGRLTDKKGKMIGNRNLLYIGLSQNLGGMLKVTEFSPVSDWVPPGYCVPKILQEKIDNKLLPIYKLFEFSIPREEQVSGVLSSKSVHDIEYDIDHIMEEDLIEDEKEKFTSMIKFLGYQNIQDKTVSDSIEALIGVYMQSNGLIGGLALLGWLGIIPNDQNPIELFNHDPPSPFVNPTTAKSSVNNFLPNYRKIEAHLGYSFQNRGYLLQALTHASYTTSRLTDCYQRLEFLGDAVLDFLITCHIYEISTDLTPGQLTDLRSALVNNITFAGLAVRHGFHKHLKSMNTKLIDVIDTFVRYQEERNFVINAEILILSEEDSSPIAEHVHIPKVLGDLWEALAGAVFLDSGFDLVETWRVFHQLMWKEIEQFRKDVPKSPVRLLYECVGAAPHFDDTRLMENGETMIGLTVIVDGKKRVVYGFGETKSQAKRAAAKIALTLISENKKIR